MSFPTRRRPLTLHFPANTHDFLGTVEYDHEEIEGMSHEQFHAYSAEETRHHMPDATHMVCLQCGAKIRL